MPKIKLQRHILDCKKNYDETNMDGLCNGLTHMVMQADMIGELDQLTERLITLCKLPSDQFVTTLENATNHYTAHIQEIKKAAEQAYIQLNGEEKENMDTLLRNDLLTQQKIASLQKILNNFTRSIDEEAKKLIYAKELKKILQNAYIKKITEERLLAEKDPVYQADIKYINIPVFLAGVNMHQLPTHEIVERHQRITYQDEKISAPHTYSLELEKQGGYTKADFFTGIYTKEELLDYLNCLQTSIKTHSPLVPIKLILGSINHALYVSYDINTHKWKFFDANVEIDPEADHIEIIKQLSTKDLVDEIFSAFFAKKQISFSTSIYTTPALATSVDEVIKGLKNQDSWKKIHKVTKKKAKLTDDWDASWLSLATRATEPEIEIIKGLIKNGASVTIEPNLDPEGNKLNILHDAVEKGCLEVVKLLVTNGANPASLYLGWDALKFAGKNGRTDIIKYFLEFNAGKNYFRANQIAEAAYVAADYGAIDSLNYLLETFPAILNSKIPDETLLHPAVVNNDLELVQFLLEKGAKPTIGTQHTLLHIATENNNLPIIKALLKKGAQDSLSSKGHFSLHLAIRKQSLTLTHLFLWYGFNSNCLDNNNMTPLYIAVSLHNVDLTKKLLYAKGNPNLASVEGNTPIDLAVQSNSIEFLKILLKHSTIPIEQNVLDSALKKAIKHMNFDMIELLINAGAKPYATLSISEIMQLLNHIKIQSLLTESLSNDFLQQPTASSAIIILINQYILNNKNTESIDLEIMDQLKNAVLKKSELTISKILTTLQVEIENIYPSTNVFALQSNLNDFLKNLKQQFINKKMKDTIAITQDIVEENVYKKTMS